MEYGFASHVLLWLIGAMAALGLAADDARILVARPLRLPQGLSSGPMPAHNPRPRTVSTAPTPRNTGAPDSRLEPSPTQILRSTCVFERSLGPDEYLDRPR